MSTGLYGKRREIATIGSSRNTIARPFSEISSP